MKNISIPLQALLLIAVQMLAVCRIATAQSDENNASFVDVTLRDTGAGGGTTMHGTLRRAEFTNMILSVSNQNGNSDVVLPREELASVTYQGNAAFIGALSGALALSAAGYFYGDNTFVSLSNSGEHKDGLGTFISTFVGVTAGAVIGWIAGSFIPQNHTIDFDSDSDYYRALPVIQNVSTEEEPPLKKNKRPYEKLEVRW